MTNGYELSLFTSLTSLKQLKISLIEYLNDIEEYIDLTKLVKLKIYQDLSQD